MIKLKKFLVNDIELQPVKFITKDFWDLTQTLFCSSYKTARKNNGSRKIPYDDTTNKFFRIVIARLNGQMIGFIKVINFDNIIDYIEEKGENVFTRQHPFWNKNRPENFNRKQIETCWVNPRYQGQGIATKLYKFAIENMGATHIHIDENRVIENLEYWQELGFTKCSLYNFLGSEIPSLRLHLDYECQDLWNLDYNSLCRMFYDRDITPIFGRSKYQNNKKAFA
jgi:GNAT superfamily N-acetyltransferase